ncbi:MAG: hypothetical protein JO154_14970 [Chitinophaga sp.]|uniref:M57 family metalloprotease n=1 Tax=Chitinophaga sp. TaxID=1869181 RepID=UPI0025B9AD01|nr:M57 family metalloprotease [Chitinophaga sp.]MBV8253903.1 hypothetical protein [Chitinophaga sp.]
MNKTFVKLAGTAAVSMALFFVACKKGNVESQSITKEAPASAEEISKMKQYLTQTTGLKESLIVYDADRQVFFMQGDIVLSRKDVQDYMKNKPYSGNGPTTEQYRYPYVLNNTVVTNIRIKDHISDPSWKKALRDAIKYWNNYNMLGSSTKIIFTIYSDDVATDLVASDNMYENSTTIAYAYYPKSNGATGDSLRINTFHNYLSPELKAYAITHELGHTLGFMHADGSGGALIPGTPSSDQNSLMWPVIPTTAPSPVFDYYDLTAARYIYPRTPNASGNSGSINTMAGVDIGIDDGSFYFGLGGNVTRGNSGSIYGEMNSYSLAAGKTPADVVEIGIANTNLVYVWYKDGTLSTGGFSQLNTYPALNITYPYTLPAGKTPANIVGISISKQDGKCYAWYNDGTYSVGNSGNFAYYSGPQPYTVPAGKSFSDIRAVGIAETSDKRYFWYKDNTCSVGTSSNASSYESPYPVTNY